MIRPVDTAAKVRQSEGVAQVDQAIQTLAEGGASDLDESLARLGAAVLSLSEGTTKTVATSSEVFDEITSREYRRFLAICLLRVLARRRDAFEQGPFRLAAVKLFDEVLSADLYPLAGVRVEDQGHKKLDSLSDLVAGAERALSEIATEVGEKTDFSAVRSVVMRTIKSGAFASVVGPFVGRLATPARLDEVLGAVHDFEKVEEDALLDAYRRARASLAVYTAETAAIPTDYGQGLNDFASALSDRINARYAQSPAVQPAAVRLAQPLKKYPLHVVGAEIHLLVEVTNGGPGYAYDAQVRVDSAEGVSVLDESVSLGTLSPRTVTVPFRARVAAAETSPTVRTVAEWRDADGQRQKVEEVLPLDAQDPSIAWDEVRRRDPYALEPVVNEDDLVGREAILETLAAMAAGETVGSAIIRGQKRVGKTSIARALQSRLQRNGKTVESAFLEVGPYGGDSVTATVGRLCPRICRELRDSIPEAADIDIPSFADGSAAPLIDFVGALQRRKPGTRVLLFLDEFDELPPTVFGPADVARSFFMTLRALSNQRDIGLVLIGGEKMEFALALHGDALNKFADHRVGYVDLRDNFGDFAELVRAPARPVLEFTDEAVARVHEETQGHPYFTKMICRAVWREAVETRDAHVTVREIEDAIREAVSGAATTSFQHFWSDGIRGSAEEQATISLERRKLFVALAEVLRSKRPAPEADVLAAARQLEMSETQARAVLNECVQRDVLVHSNATYEPRVPFFSRWLREFGPSRIGAQLASSDILVALKRRDEELRVTPNEIKDVTDRWGTYQGTKITPEDVRSWLDQVIGPEAQRLLFKILQGLRFYGGPDITEKFRMLHAAAFPRQAQPEGPELRRTDVVVSYLDHVGKSGPTYAQRYRLANRIDYDNVAELGALDSAIDDRRPRALVFVDDFVGSGSSLAETIATIPDQLVTKVREQKILVGFACVAGFADGLQHVQAAFRERGFLRTRVNAADTLTAADRCFSSESRFFSSEAERGKAEEIVARFGRNLEPQHPLGFHDGQAAIVFETRCPNNALPVLWAARADWRPLFPRH